MNMKYFDQRNIKYIATRYVHFVCVIRLISGMKVTLICQVFRAAKVINKQQNGKKSLNKLELGNRCKRNFILSPKSFNESERS